MLFVVLLNKQHVDEMFKMISKCMQLKLNIDILICFFMYNNCIRIQNIEIYVTYMLHNTMIHNSFANKYYNLPPYVIQFW